MLVILRFFREHLRSYIYAIIGGTILLILAAICQAIQIGMLRLVFDESKTVHFTFLHNLMSIKYVLYVKHLILKFLPVSFFVKRSIYTIPICIILVYLVKGLLTYSGTLLIDYSGIRATISLREALFSHLLEQELAFFHKYSVGELLQRCIGDLNSVQGIASTYFADAIREVSLALAMMITIFVLNWRVSIYLFIIGPIVVWLVKQLNKKIRVVNHSNLEASSFLLQRLKEVFSNIRVVFSFARERFEKGLFHSRNNELCRFMMKTAQTKAISHPIMELVGGLLLSSLLIYTYHKNNGAFGGSSMVAYLIAVQAFYDPIRRLTKLNNEAQLAGVSLERVYTLLSRKSKIISPLSPTAFPDRFEHLVFKSVCFAYEKNKNKHNYILNNVDLTISKGETVALVGKSGGGKTTMINLVPRFFDPTFGYIAINGIDLKQFDPKILRLNIGIVTQETMLFMDSIHNNIAYGRVVDRQSVIEVAKKAQAHEFIVKLPNGYDTFLGESGLTISGGQRQRITIARALLQNPPVLILDEATSALDTENEAAVQCALQALMKDRTTLVIAHRLSTIKRSSRICVLKRGRIVEIGHHSELLACGGEYSRLYQLQVKK